MSLKVGTRNFLVVSPVVNLGHGATKNNGRTNSDQIKQHKQQNNITIAQGTQVAHWLGRLLARQ